MRHLKTLKKKSRTYISFTITRVGLFVCLFVFILMPFTLKYTKKVKVSVVLYSESISQDQRTLHKPRIKQIVKV